MQKVSYKASPHHPRKSLVANRWGIIAFIHEAFVITSEEFIRQRVEDTGNGTQTEKLCWNLPATQTHRGIAPRGLDVDPAGNFKKVFDLGGSFKFCCFMVCLGFFVEPTL